MGHDRPTSSTPARSRPERPFLSRLAIAFVLIILLQPWLLIGGLLYNDWAHYGLSLTTVLFALGWVAIFLALLWYITLNLRLALRLADGLGRKINIALVVLAGILMAAVTCFPLVVLPAGARWVPNEEPTETRRVVHPLGFSIVSPPGWKARMWNVDKDEAGLALGPGYKGRHGPGLGVLTDLAPRDLSQFSETKFLDAVAWERTITGTGENARLSYTLVVSNNGRWYRVSYSESRAFEDNPSPEFPAIINRYIRSFRPAP